MPPRRKPLLERFERYLPELLDEDTCWPWQGCRNRDGYGKISMPGEAHRTLLAHRVAWEAHNAEPIPPDMFVCHTCDNPPCVNPAHLFLGDNRLNVADMVQKRRNCKGVSHPLAKLSEDAVLQIRELGSTGIGIAAIAKMCGIGKSHVSQILNGALWAHLPTMPVDLGPGQRGESSPRAKLTEEQVRSIRRAAANGATQAALARCFGVSCATVSSIVLRRSWRHLP